MYMMKNTIKNLVLLFVLFCLSPIVQSKSPQHLLLGGSGWNKIAIINKETKEIVWEYPLEKGWECNSVAATPDGNILFSYAKGAKVIIAGTDSLGIMLAESDILYDRIQMIHTSHVPYAEFSRLLGGKTLDDYIEYGGTLTKSPYKTLQASEEYQNTAIVGNILHSLEKSEDARRYGAAITELYEQNELKSVLNKMMNKFSYYTAV